MSSQLFFRDYGRIWSYNVVTKDAHSNQFGLGNYNLFPKKMRLETAHNIAEQVGSLCSSVI